jgi:cytochrome P450
MMTDLTSEVAPFPQARECPWQPPSQLTKLMDEGPLVRVRLWDGSTPWLVTRYAEQVQLLADPRISVDTTNPGYPHAHQGSWERRNDNKGFIKMDDPDHTTQRRMLTSSFTTKRVEGLRPRIQAIVDGLIDDMLKSTGPVDLVQAFALPVPSLVICELLGVPYDQHAFFQRCSNAIVSQTMPGEQVAAAYRELSDYLAALTEAKMTDPGDDVLSRLAVEQVATGKLTLPEAAVMGLLILVGGHETTANMISLGTFTLLQNPDKLDELRYCDDPALVASAVEELLRLLTINMIGRRRVATADIEIAGMVIRAGEGVIAAGDLGNRDESAFPDPYTIDLHRQSRHHQAFGFGPHQCLGQQLARVELQVVYSTLYRRIPTLRLAVPAEEVPFKDDMTVYGAYELPVTW